MSERPDVCRHVHPDGEILTVIRNVDVVITER
jgi:hypothetical protein